MSAVLDWISLISFEDFFELWQKKVCECVKGLFDIYITGDTSPLLLSWCGWPLSESNCFCSLFTMYSCSCSKEFSISIFSRWSWLSFFWSIFVMYSSSCSTCKSNSLFSFLSPLIRFNNLFEIYSSSCSATAFYLSFEYSVISIMDDYHFNGYLL